MRGNNVSGDEVRRLLVFSQHRICYEDGREMRDHFTQVFVNRIPREISRHDALSEVALAQIQAKTVVGYNGVKSAKPGEDSLHAPREAGEVVIANRSGGDYEVRFNGMTVHREHGSARAGPNLHQSCLVAAVMKHDFIIHTKTAANLVVARSIVGAASHYHLELRPGSQSFTDESQHSRQPHRIGGIARGIADYHQDFACGAQLFRERSSVNRSFHRRYCRR